MVSVSSRLAAATLSLAAAALPGASRAQADMTPKQIAERFRDSVVGIRATTAEGVSRGTGFFFESGGKVATSYHVIKGATRIEIVERGGKVWHPSFVAYDERTDLAFLTFEWPTDRRPILPAPSGSVGAGDPVVVIGDPLGMSGSVGSGIVSALRRFEGVEEVQFTAPISPGNSGGPVLDARGRLVGVVRATMAKGQNVNFAVGADEVVRYDKRIWTMEGFRAQFLAKEFYARSVPPPPGKETVPEPAGKPPEEGEGAGRARARARTSLVENLARICGELYEAESRWSVDWDETVRQDAEAAVPRLNDARDRFGRACNVVYLTFLRENCVAAGVSSEAVWPFLEACFGLSSMTDERANAGTSVRVARFTGAEALAQANANHAAEVARMRQAMDGLIPFVATVPWVDQDVFAANLPDTFFGVLALRRFGAFVDFDVPGACVVRHAAAHSRLRRGDRIVAVGEREGEPLVPVTRWRDVRTFSYADGKKARPISRLRVVREGNEIDVAQGN